MNRPEVAVPELDHDAEMLATFGEEVSLSGRLERRIVAALVAYLAVHGFKVQCVDDGGERCPAGNVKQAMETVFSVNDSRVYFKKAERTHWVLLIGGNGIDIISDWDYTPGDPDGFNDTMDAFDVEQYA